MHDHKKKRFNKQFNNYYRADSLEDCAVLVHEELADSVFFYFVRRGVDRIEAEELVQEVYVRVIESLRTKRYSSRKKRKRNTPTKNYGNAYGYVFGVCRFVWLEWIRKKYKDSPDFATGKAPHKDGVRHVLTREFINQVYACISKLTKDDWKDALDRYVIPDTEAKSEKIRRRKSEAMQELERCLKKHGFEAEYNEYSGNTKGGPA